MRPKSPLAVPPKGIRACVCSLPSRALRGAPWCVGKSPLDLVRRRTCVHAWSTLSSAYACPLQAKARILNTMRPASVAVRIERSACGGFVANGGVHHRQLGWRDSACTPGQFTDLGRAPSRERINAAIARLRTVALHVVPCIEHALADAIRATDFFVRQARATIPVRFQRFPDRVVMHAHVGCGLVDR